MSMVVGRGQQSKSTVTIRRPERFKPSTIAHSGVNPLGSFHSFMKHDAIRNIDVRRDEKPPVSIEKDFSFMKGRVPVGTKTFIYETGKLGKDGKLDRANIFTKDLPINKTDHISYDPPTATRPQQKVYDQMMTQPRYAKNHQSSTPWVIYDDRAKLDRLDRMKAGGAPASTRSQAPDSKRSQIPESKRSQVPASKRSVFSDDLGLSKTLNNRSSVHHNIITGQNNIYSCDMKPGLLDKQVCNRKLGITQIKDLSGPSSINRNPDYVKAWGQSENTFKKQNGIYTHLYNAAHRFGETQVFKA